MKMKIIACMFAASVFLSVDVWAKRIPAPDVKPIIHQGVRYVAPNDDGRREYVQAWNIATTNKLWEVTVVRNRIKFWLEEDVQWVYISHLQVENGKLVVTDERKRQFEVDLKTGKVQKKGTANQAPEDTARKLADHQR